MANRNHPLTTLNQVRKRFPNGIERLEIGSGQNPEPGYVHLDIMTGLPDLDIVGDARKMPLPENFVRKEVRAVHIMEHLCHPEHSGKELREKYGTTIEVLAEIYRVLKPGGKIKIVTPDFSKIATSTAKKRIPETWLQRWTVGGHLNEYDVHHWLWTFQDADNWLREVGFCDIRNTNPTHGVFERLKLDWSTEPAQSNSKWHMIEYYHWLFVEATKQ